MGAHSGPADWWTEGTDKGRTHVATKGIVTDGLVLNLDASVSASYPGTGTDWYDLSGNQLNGVLTNGPVYDSNNGGSINFLGTDDGVIITSPAALSVNQHTIVSWNYSTNYNHNGFMFEKTTNGSVNTQYSIFFNGNDRIYYRTYGLTARDLLAVTSSYVTNSQWNNVVATYDGSVKRIYVNGVLAASANSSGTVTQNTTGAAFIGIYGNFVAYPFNGKISCTKIYNRALSADEINQNFNALRNRYGL